MSTKIKPGMWMTAYEVNWVGETRFNMFRNLLKQAGYQISDNAGLFSNPMDYSHLLLTFQGVLVWINASLQLPLKACNQVTANDVIEYIGSSKKRPVLQDSYLLVVGKSTKFFDQGTVQSKLEDTIKQAVSRGLLDQTKLFNLTTNQHIALTAQHKLTLL